MFVIYISMVFLQKKYPELSFIGYVKAFSEAVDADGETVPASLSSIKDKYKIIGSYTTKTTANAVRNKNIKLAAQTVNGTIVKPGQEFSFNGTVGGGVHPVLGWGVPPLFMYRINLYLLP